MKLCVKCGKMKPLFHLDKTRPDGMHPYCRDCRTYGPKPGHRDKKVAHSLVADTIMMPGSLPTACLIYRWKGHTRKKNGYAVLWDNGRKILAHRFYYERAKGPVPPDLEIDHLCRNRKCCNPEHMEAVTAAQNVRRGKAVKLNETQALEIRQMALDGTPQTTIARLYKVSPQAINSVVKWKTWKVIALLLAGCTTQIESPAGPAKVLAAPATMTDTVWTRTRTECRWCHIYQVYDPVTGGQRYPSDFNFTTRTSVDATQLSTLGFGVRTELAPFVKRLSPIVRDTLIAWAASRGYTTPIYNLPQTFDFTWATWLNQQSGSNIPRGWFFTVEDGWIDGASVNGGSATHRWRIEDVTDGQGTRHRALVERQTRTTSADSFPASQNSSVYGILGFQKYHGRFYDYTIEGDVYGLNNRWFSVFMHAEEMKPTGRDHREYVRAQFDRDAISIRSVPTANETWPWGGSGCGTEGADSKLVGHLNKCDIFLGTSRWYHFVFTSQRRTRLGGFATADTLGTLYTLQFQDPYTQETIADLYGIAINDTTSAGVWGFHSYAASSGIRAWANIQVHAKVDPVGFAVPPAPNQAGRTPRRGRTVDIEFPEP